MFNYKLKVLFCKFKLIENSFGPLEKSCFFQLMSLDPPKKCFEFTPRVIERVSVCRKYIRRPTRVHPVTESRSSRRLRVTVRMETTQSNRVIVIDTHTHTNTYKNTLRRSQKYSSLTFFLRTSVTSVIHGIWTYGWRLSSNVIMTTITIVTIIITALLLLYITMLGCIVNLITGITAIIRLGSSGRRLSRYTPLRVRTARRDLNNFI